MLGVLLDAGFTLNCRANGGSPALDEFLGGRALKHHVPLPDCWRRHEPPRYSRAQADGFIRAVESFVVQRAHWVLVLDRNEVRIVRDTLLALGDYHAGLLIEILDKHGASSRKDLRRLFAADRIKPLARAVRASPP